MSRGELFLWLWEHGTILRNDVTFSVCLKILCSCYSHQSVFRVFILFMPTYYCKNIEKTPVLENIFWEVNVLLPPPKSHPEKEPALCPRKA
jgi:hypothetical protein